MELWAGTSGYSYKEWCGHFYPEKLPGTAMLRYYAERFRTVEINNTFYRMPAESMLTQWTQQVPGGQVIDLGHRCEGAGTFRFRRRYPGRARPPRILCRSNAESRPAHHAKVIAGRPGGGNGHRPISVPYPTGGIGWVP